MNEGYSLNYLIHAFFVIIAGILGFMLNTFLAIGLIILGIMLLLVKTGVEIDCPNKYALAYQSIFGMRLGRKINLNDYKQVRLKRESHSTQMQSRGPSNVVETKVFLIQLMNDGDSKVDLYAFRKYSKAKKVFQTFVKLGYAGIDEEAELRVYGRRLGGRRIDEI